MLQSHCPRHVKSSEQNHSIRHFPRRSQAKKYGFEFLSYRWVVVGTRFCQAANWMQPRLSSVPPPATHHHRPEWQQKSHSYTRCENGKNTLFQDASFCVLKAHLLPYPSHKYRTSWLHGHLSHAVSKWFHYWRFFHNLYTLTRFSCGSLWNACGNAVNCWKLSHTLDIICPFQCSWPKGFDTTEEYSTQNFYFQRLVTLSSCKPCSLLFTVSPFSRTVWL